LKQSTCAQRLQS